MSDTPTGAYEADGCGSNGAKVTASDAGRAPSPPKWVDLFGIDPDYPLPGCECCAADLGSDPTGRSVCDPCYYAHGYSFAEACPQVKS